MFIELLDLLDTYWLTDKLIATVKDLAHEYFTLSCDLWSESFVTNYSHVRRSVCFGKPGLT